MNPEEQDREARFEELVHVVLEPLRRFLARRTDEATADDVIGDTLVVLWRRLDEVPTDAALPWSYGVARRCLANAERTDRRQERLAARIAVVDPPREATEESVEGDVDLTAALAALSPDDAELLRLWAWEDLSAAEIAVALGVTGNAAGIRLTRARQKLRTEMRKIRPGGGHEQGKEGSNP